MMRTSVVGIAVLFTFQLALAQDFQKTYEIKPGGRIWIDSFQGDVRVTGYSGTSVEVKGYKKGPGRDSIQIIDNSEGNGIELMVRPPQMPNEKSSVDFEVRVPTGIPLNFDRLASFAGSVSVSNVVGKLRAESVRGSVEVKDVLGSVSASSVSGDVIVDINRVQARSLMRFRSISGDVTVSAPSNLDALISMSSDSGNLRTDFPIDVQERRYGPGREARGRLKSGRQMMWIMSNSGRVSLIQKPERQPS